jgi:hypothetical protein
MSSDDTASRLERLERECRFLRRGMAAVLLGGTTLVLMGQARPERKNIEAQHFIVKDEAGENRASLGMGPNGGVGLNFMGQNQVRIGVALDGAGISMLDTAGRLRLTLGIRADGSAGLVLMNAEQKPRIGLNLRADDTPEIVLRGADGAVRASLRVTQPDGSAGLLLMDGSGNVRGAFASEPQGSAGLDLMDRAAATRAHVGVKAEGAPSITLADEKGTVLERHPAH